KPVSSFVCEKLVSSSVCEKLVSSSVCEKLVSTFVASDHLDLVGRRTVEHRATGLITY
ncbi:Dipeptidyl-peptidase 5, partial [Pyrenophora tritici-repentis]